MVDDPRGLAAAGQPDHHDHLALRALRDAGRPPLAALLHAGGKFKALRQGEPRLLRRIQIYLNLVKS